MANEARLLIRADDKASKTIDDVGGKFESMAGKAGVALATFGAATGALAVAGGAALLKLGMSFDSAYDTIQIGTGATGKSLDGLKDSFKNVFSSVPTDMASAATAIADLNTRTGATGFELENLSKTMLEMTRITGGDLTANIESVTRAMGDWGISGEDSATMMDELFAASQATGIGIDTLASQLVQFGAPLRQLGFSFETSAALLAKFEKEGVNAELVMGSLRIALGKLAKDGIPAEQGLRDVMQSIKDAGDASEANLLAIELFGARAGPDMAAAIREGRFEVDELVETLKNADGTILETAASTNDFGEKWKMTLNKVKVGLEPAAMAVLDFANMFMDKVIPKIEAFGGVLKDKVAPVLAEFGGILKDKVAPVLADFGGALKDKVAPLLADFGGVLKDKVAPLLADFGSLLKDKVLPTVKDFGTAGFDFLKGKAGDLSGFIKGTAVPAFADFGRLLKDRVLPAAKELADAGWDRMSGPIGTVAESIRSLFDSVRGVDTGDIQEALGGLGDAMRDLMTTLEPVFSIWRDLGSGILDGLSKAFSDIGRAIKEELGPAFASWGPALESAMPGLKAIGEIVGVVLVAAVTSALFVLDKLIPVIAVGLIGAIKALAIIIEGLAKIFEGTFTTITGIWNTFKGLFTGDWDTMWKGLGQVMDGALLLIQGALDIALGILLNSWETLYKMLNELTQGKLGEVVGWFAALPGNIGSALGDLSSYLWQKGWDLLNGLKNGVADMWNSFQMTWWWQFGGMVVEALGDVSKLLWDVGQAIMQSLWDGMKAVWDQMTGWIGSLGGAIKNLKGPIETDRKLLEPEGKAIMEGLASGMAEGFKQAVAPVLAGVEVAIKDAFSGKTFTEGGIQSLMSAAMGAANSDVPAYLQDPGGWGSEAAYNDAVSLLFANGQQQLNNLKSKNPNAGWTGDPDEDVKLALALMGGAGGGHSDALSAAEIYSNQFEKDLLGSMGGEGGWLGPKSGGGIIKGGGGASTDSTWLTAAKAALGSGAQQPLVIMAIDAASFREWLNRGGGDEIMRWAQGRKVFA